MMMKVVIATHNKDKLKELKKGFGVKQIHSEYGMTELLSQAYSKGNGCYKCPPWMKVSFRDVTDPLSTNKKQGGINIIDLANIYSCSFIATQDLGKMVDNMKQWGSEGQAQYVTVQTPEGPAKLLTTSYSIALDALMKKNAERGAKGKDTYKPELYQ